MRILQLRKASVGFMLLTGSMVTTGCKTTSWNPTSMFAWNRGADVSTLAESEGAELPESPAAKYTPGTIASVGANNQGSGASADPNATNPGTASAYGYTVDTRPGAGLAAESNGYTTGPYQVSGSTADTQANLPNPYGGAYGGAPTTTAPDITLPNSAREALAQEQGRTGSYPTAQLPTTPLNPQNSLNTGYSPNVSGAVQNYPSIPGGTAGAPAAQSPGNLPLPGDMTMPSGQTSSTGQPHANLPAIPKMTTQSPDSSDLPATGESAPDKKINRYAPGSTGRATNYNFNIPAPSASTGMIPAGVSSPQ